MTAPFDLPNIIREIINKAPSLSPNTIIEREKNLPSVSTYKQTKVVSLLISIFVFCDRQLVITDDQIHKHNVKFSGCLSNLWCKGREYVSTLNKNTDFDDNGNLVEASVLPCCLSQNDFIPVEKVKILRIAVCFTRGTKKKDYNETESQLQLET